MARSTDLEAMDNTENSMNDINLENTVESASSQVTVTSASKRKNETTEESEQETDQMAAPKRQRVVKGKATKVLKEAPKKKTAVKGHITGTSDTEKDGTESEAEASASAPKQKPTVKTAVKKPIKRPAEKSTGSKTLEECRNIIVRIMEAEQKQPEKISFVRIKEISRVVHRVLKKDMDNFREAFKELLNENFLENVTGGSGLTGSFMLVSVNTRKVTTKKGRTN